MNFYNLWNQMENSDEYYPRNILRRDLQDKPDQGDLLHFVKSHSHPTLSHLDDESLRQHLINMATMTDSIVICTRRDVTDIHGLAIVMKVGKRADSKWLEIPIFLAANTEVANKIVDQIIQKHLKDGPFKKQMIYIQLPYDTNPVAANALVKKGFEIEPHGDMLLAKYPKSNMMHGNLFSTYNKHLHGEPEKPYTPFTDSEPEQAGDKNPNDSDDEYGLFKGTPWGN